MVTTADYWPALWWSAPLQRLFVQEQGAEKKVMNRTARAWYKRYAYSAKLDRIVDHNEGPKVPGQKDMFAPVLPRVPGQFSRCPCGFGAYAYGRTFAGLTKFDIVHRRPTGEWSISIESVKRFRLRLRYRITV